jgi:hypothetical protein
MTTQSTPPRTVKDLRARIRARGLDWVVRYKRTRHTAFDNHFMLWPDSDTMIVLEGPRLRCLELAWRIVEGERG